MAWIESHQELGRHPKVKKLARKLDINIPQAIGHLHFLWWWALDFAEDGDLNEYDQDDISDAGAWEGEASTFLDALIETGFIDIDKRLHDWHDYAGKLLARRDKNKERMKTARATNVRDTCNAQTAHVQDTCEATVPNRTVPNTEEEEEATPSIVSEPTDETIGNLTFTVYGCSGTAAQEITDYIDATSKAVVAEALRNTIANARSARAAYFRKIMSTWMKLQVKTLADVQRVREAHNPQPTKGTQQEESASDRLRRMRERGEINVGVGRSRPAS